MNKNMGDTDRTVRGVAAVLLLLVAWAVGFGTIGGAIAIVFAIVMAGTAVVGFCPLYAPFHIDTGHRASGAH
jgi:hypothetical protein